jgi:hypothetical protein
MKIHEPITEEQRIINQLRKQVKEGEQVNDFAIEALAVLSKVLHAMILEHDITLKNMQSEVAETIKKGMKCQLKN